MSSIDLHAKLGFTNVLSLTTISSDTDTLSSGVKVVDVDDSTLSFEGNVIALKTETITDGNYTLSLEDDDNPAFSAPVTVPLDQTKGIDGVTLTSTSSDSVFKIGYTGDKNNFRLKITSTSTSTGGEFSAMAVQSNATVGPVL